MESEGKENDESLDEVDATIEPSRFSAVADAIDVGDREAAVQLLRNLDTMDRSDILLLCELLDDDHSYAASHPYRLDVRARGGVGKPGLPVLTRVERDFAIRAAVRGWEGAGKNLKQAIHIVANELEIKEATVEKAYQRGGKRLLFKKKKQTK